MKTEIVRHGEVILKPIKELPQDIKKVITTNDYVVAHSETGHHHVLTAEKDINIYSSIDGGKTFIEIPAIGKLWHKKSGKDIHKTHSIAPGVYEVIIKKEFNYFSGLLQRVRD